MSTQKKVLGRGLGALIPQKQQSPEAPAGEPMAPGNALMQLRIEQIAPNPFQPRKSFNESSIDELARSVAEHGIVQPLVAFPCGSPSTSRTRCSAAARLAARFTAVVVLPTPPFWLAIANMRPT